ncbi:MAG TPA: hypothetical protein VEX60_17575 [Pyrinomonadaceae bacterium]|nr:hypothetical protein [Pyrinomonadaceae bacterium]
MKSKDKQHLAPSMVEDGAMERLKKRAQDLGLIVNAGLKRGTVASQTKTTRKLDQSVKRAADKEMGGEKKRGKS